MTVCITSGFAKRKRYVGTIYACDGSDFPATDDRGTVQFSGPYESAQTVPATTVAYTIIGKTPCGDDIRRITTRTYSSRAVANQWKAQWNWLGGGSGGAGVLLYTALPEVSQVAPLTNPSVKHYSYGATQAAAHSAACIAQRSSYLSVSPYTNSVYDGNVYVMTAQTFIITNEGLATEYYAMNGTLTVNGSLTTTSLGTFIKPVTATQLTLYYLDVQEVWTFDLI